MAVTYKKLFHLLIDRGIPTTELTEKAGFNANILTRLRRDQYVSLKTSCHYQYKYRCKCRLATICRRTARNRYSNFD